MSFILFTLALAGPVDRKAERAWLLVEDGRMEEARTLLAESITDAPDAQLVVAYLDASTEMGLGPYALAETRGLPVELPWEDMAEPLAGLMVDGTQNAAAYDLAKRLREAYADHPDLLAPLWQDSGGGKLGRMRAAVLGTPPLALEGKARQLRLRQLVRVPDPSLRVAVEQGFGLDAYGPPARDVELHDAARALAEKGLSVADLDLRPEERRKAVERAHPMFLGLGVPEKAAQAWEQLGSTDAGAWGHRAEALRLMGDAAGSQEAVERGLRSLGAPVPGDVTVADLSLRATWAIQLMAAASEVELKQEHGGHAWAYSVAATALAGEARGAALGPAAATILAATYRGSDKVGAAMSQAIKATDPTDRRAHVMGAWIAVASGAGRLEDVGRTRELYLEALGQVWREAALLFSEGEGADPEIALAYSILAMASGQVDRVLLARVAALHDQLDGDLDRSYAAFHYAAMARGMGADRDEMEAWIHKHHQGMGAPLDIATALGGEPPPPDAVAAAPERRSVRASGRRSKPPTGGAVLGERVPDFTVETAFGTLSRSSLAGRVVIFTFFVSDDAASVEQLKESGQVAKRLRARGIDVVHVGISRDANRGRFDDLHRVGQRWGQLAWDPELATRFGVPRQPTTWLMDRNGVARYFVDHRVGSADLQAQVEAVAVR